jgi:IS30 family transposase
MAYFANFSKDKSMDSVTIVDVQHAQYGLNHHHRKSLGYLCPADYYHELST